MKSRFTKFTLVALSAITISIGVSTGAIAGSVTLPVFSSTSTYLKYYNGTTYQLSNYKKIVVWNYDNHDEMKIYNNELKYSQTTGFYWSWVLKKVIDLPTGSVDPVYNVKDNGSGSNVLEVTLNQNPILTLDTLGNVTMSQYFPGDERIGITPIPVP